MRSRRRRISIRSPGTTSSTCQLAGVLFTMPEVHTRHRSTARRSRRPARAGRCGSRDAWSPNTETWTYAAGSRNQPGRSSAGRGGRPCAWKPRSCCEVPKTQWLCRGLVRRSSGQVESRDDDATVRGGELRTVAIMAEVTLAVCDHRFAVDLEAAAIPDLTTLLSGGSKQDDLTQLTARKQGQLRNVATAADDVCMLAFTSGTTGRPKATMHFHRDILAIADTFSRHVLHPTPDDLFAGSPHCFHVRSGQIRRLTMRLGAATTAWRNLRRRLARRREAHG